MKWRTILSMLVVALLKIQEVESRGMFKNEEVDDGDRKDFEIWQSFSTDRRASSTQKHHPDVSKREPSDFNNNEKNENTKKKKIRHWNRMKRSLSRDLYKNLEVEFVDLPTNDQITELNSYAVREPIKSTTNHSHLISLMTAVMLIVVLVICLHAPCTCLMRKRHKNDLEVDLIGCPNPTARKGRCGKCIFDKASKNYASRYRVTTKSTYSSSSATKEELFLSPDYQPPWMTDSSKGPSSNLPNPKKSKSIVQAILKRSRDRDKFRYEFLATKYGYDYQQFGNSGKRSSVYDEQDPNWYSPGEFLNNQSSFRGQKNYGSTDFNKINGGSYCQWSRDSRGTRDSGKSINQSVEDIIKLQPKRRQVVELKDFPLGYSGSYAGVEMKSKENDLFDPIQDGRHPCKHAGNPSAMSESNLDMYFSRMDKKNPNSRSAEGGVKFGQGREKPRATSPKSGPKLVQFYPTSFDYNTKFVQNERKSKSIGKEKDWLGDSDFDEEVSSDEVLSFDEADEFQPKQDFLYSPHMQGYRPCHHHNQYYPGYYPALLRYPDVPRHITRPPREYKTRMRRDVARSESELRRASGLFGNRMPHDGHSRRGNHVSPSDTSLDRMQIENELAAAGLVKPRKKKTKEYKMTVRDNRLEPLAGIMSPMRPLENSKNTRAWDNTANDRQDQILAQNTMEKTGPDQSYVVKLPSLQPSCKEDLDSKVAHPQHDINISIKGSKRERIEPNYDHNSIEFDPHYLKNSYLRDEPVRDTDSEDATENIAPYLPSHCRVTTGNEGKPREEGFPSSRSTTL
ncbi:uncharacterized protein LOC116304884 isoform X2 [Actinia tenebrosa]|uniref:Uncharacterized protein LOC116304884 isoform X2 n=1 Tax=Actinia tenebrosa TaxID=6105 RepID=A0A6P8IUD0_ACTTE|nr:uncharacterized protein LOC116304884 isoform X2 [Actinia tenebrosa]